jgi:hypothetical protein
MSEAHLRFASRIAAPPEIVFDLIADMPNYGRWLPDSSRLKRYLEARASPPGDSTP